MSIEVALLLSIVSVAFSVYLGLKNNKRADSDEVVKKAAEMATVNVKLDEIGKNVTDIKYDITATKKDVQELSNKMIIVEQSVKSAHHRIDEMRDEGA